MEKLTNIKVSGFRSLRDVDIDLGSISVLIGANGSGKSNFVALLKLLSFMASGHLQVHIAREGYATSILHYGPKRTPALHVELTFRDEHSTSCYSFSMAFGAPDRLIFTSEKVKFHRPGEPQPHEQELGSGHDETRLGDIASRDEDTVPRRVARDFLQRFEGLQGYHFHDTSDTASIRLSQSMLPNHMLQSTGANLWAFLLNLSQGWPAHYERIVQAIRLVVPYLHELVLRLPTRPKRPEDVQVMLRWQDRNPDYEFGPHQLSDGSLRAIALITALLQPDELLPSLIVIDEPELGLHPSAIATIGQLIKAVSLKRQVIVATQSPRLLAMFDPSDVVVVEREEEPTGHAHSRFRRLSHEGLTNWLESYDLGQLYDMNVTGGGPG